MSDPAVGETEGAPALVAEGLACRRGERWVFAGVDCRLMAGGSMLLTGSNGSGKSSLLRVLATLLTPEAGRLLWRGTPIGDDMPRYRAALHYAGHLDGVKPAMTPREMLAFWGALRGAAMPVDAPAINAALTRFGLAAIADWPCRWLSAGQRRRLALARLVATSAPLWLLDEPTAALDVDGEERLTAAIAAHRAAGGSVVVATHQPLDLPGATRLVLDDYAAPPADALAAIW
ncbi:MAG TPA: heme ABC exporter ATP-binding protein CcmA [Stellaceae bacterium]|nr:heme ABC exporter ATP-binding protein CcmA [Stellaceae bacterium]